MSKWTDKHILQLQKEGKILGAVIPKRQKNYSSDHKPVTIPREKPKGLIWLEWNLAWWCNQKVVTLEREYEFDPERKWRSDFAIPAFKILIEYEGGIYMNRGAHNSPGAIHRDIEKYQRAQELGYRLIRVTAKIYTTILFTLNKMVQ